jgi:mannose-6-phosphate isomerase-like protein (cupin superfamily)
MPQNDQPHHRLSAPNPPRPEPVPLLVRRDDLPGSPAARRFIGADHGALPVSLFLVDDRPGAGPQLHRHPYPELFVVHRGTAAFRIDDAGLAATAGDILIAPAGTAHGFTNIGAEQLRITAIHTAPRISTDWLAPAPAPRASSGDRHAE